MHVAVQRALKFLFGVALMLVLLFFALAYGLYSAGARHVPDTFGPTGATYPQPVRDALWRIQFGSEPVAIDAMSPPGLLWRWLDPLRQARRDRLPRDPAMSALSRVARLETLRALPMRDHHLAQAAMAIQASRWPDDRIVDTILDRSYFGGDAVGLRAGARRVFARPLESLEAEQVALLVGMMGGAGHFDPWCHGDRLRERLSRSSGLDAARIDAAFARLAPPPLDSSCW